MIDMAALRRESAAAEREARHHQRLAAAFKAWKEGGVEALSDGQLLTLKLDSGEGAFLYGQEAAAELKRRVEERRSARLSARPATPAAVPAPKCSRCQRRDRHFDDLCKRCANELGVRPTGRV